MADSTDTRGQPAEAAHQGLAEVVSYCDGDLSGEAALAFEAHLAECPACQRLLRRAERVLAEVDRIVDRPEPEWLHEADAVTERLRVVHISRPATGLLRAPWSMPRQPSQRFWLPLAGFGLIAGVVALIQLGLALKLPQWGRKAPAEATSSPAATVGAAP